MSTRRDILTCMLGAPLAAWACRVSRTAVPAVVVGASSQVGHRARDFAGAIPSSVPRRRASVVVVGAGPSGLTAAYALVRSGVSDVVVLEAEPRVGGTSASGESDVTRYPWGAHYLPVPGRENSALVAWLADLGVWSGEDAWGDPVPAEHLLVRDPEERLFMHGKWHAGIFPALAGSPEDLRQWHAFHKTIAALAGMRDGAGRRPFALPARNGSDDSEFRALDQVSFHDWLNAQGFTSPPVRWMAEYACRDDHGARLTETSAWAGLFYFGSRLRPSGPSAAFLAWPEGNGRLVRALCEPIQAKMELNTAVIRVTPSSMGAEVAAMQGEQLLCYQASHVILAVPQGMAARLMPLAPERAQAARAFRYGSWLVANLHLSSRPQTHGAEAAWDNVIYDSPSLGYVIATHQRGAGSGPTVWTYYLPLTDPDEKRARAWLLSLSAEEAADVVMQDLMRAHPDLPRCVDRVEIFKHGHAMVRPDVGFFFNASRRDAQTPTGPVHFAHCDLSGLPLFEEAFDHGLRAAREVLRDLGMAYKGPV